MDQSKVLSEEGKTLGERLRAARLAKGWSLRKLEMESGVSNSLISQIETGANDNPNLNTLVRLADALGKEISELLHRRGERELIRAAIEGDQDARTTLIERNMWIVLRVVQQEEIRRQAGRLRQDVDDLISVGTIGLIKGVSTYREELGSFQSFLIQRVEQEIHDFFRGVEAQQDNKLRRLEVLSERMEIFAKLKDLRLERDRMSQQHAELTQALKELESSRDELEARIAAHEQRIAHLEATYNKLVNSGSEEDSESNGES